MIVREMIEQELFNRRRRSCTYEEVEMQSLEQFQKIQMFKHIIIVQRLKRLLEVYT